MDADVELSSRKVLSHFIGVSATFIGEGDIHALAAEKLRGFRSAWPPWQAMHHRPAFRAISLVDYPGDRFSTRSDPHGRTSGRVAATVCGRLAGSVAVDCASVPSGARATTAEGRTLKRRIYRVLPCLPGHRVPAGSVLFFAAVWISDFFNQIRAVGVGKRCQRHRG